MSWWSSSEIEKEILKATSSSIPSGEQDLPLNLEISDSVRSKRASAQEVVKVLKKRLYDINPNVQILTLHLIDLLVKNGGQHFIVESVSKDFVDAYVAQLTSLINQNRNPEVVGLMLDYFQTWALASAGKPEAQYLRDKYEELKKRRDIEFPDASAVAEISASFLDSATPPEWVDSETCMKSGQPFNFYNRKHHCRNCGGVFLQEYCANFRTLPHFGINIPERVCDDCNRQLDEKYNSHRRHSAAGGTAADSPQSAARAATAAALQQPKRISSNNRDIGSRYQDDLDEAIRLSLQASRQAQPLAAAAGGSSRTDEEEEMDEEMKQAIAASLAEIRQPRQQQPASAPASAPANAPANASGARTEQSQSAHPNALPSDRRMVEEFFAAVNAASPHEAIYNQKLINMNRAAIELQPKIVSELRISSKNLSTLEDLHGKMLAVANYYDKLLEAELNPELQLPPAPAPAAPAAPAAAPRAQPVVALASQTPPAEQPAAAATEPLATKPSCGLRQPASQGYNESSGRAPGAGAQRDGVQRDGATEPVREPVREPEPEPEPEPESEPILIEL